ncbi:HAD domain-containing protein [Variovorax sp. M-6]|uniref:HAD domain-containing protein n=1 Tax=Variovorax sp. M-6 TaxID=3233041 RepID=UPI003F9DA4C7
MSSANGRIFRNASDIGGRIIGATPPPRRDQAGYGHARREGEICEWLTANGGVDQPWVALDDAEWQFDRHIGRLVACSSFIGFDDEAYAALRAHFERSLHREKSGLCLARFDCSSPYCFHHLASKLHRESNTYCRRGRLQ